MKLTIVPGLSANILGIAYLIAMLAKPVRMKRLSASKKIIRRMIAYALIFICLDLIYQILHGCGADWLRSVAFAAKSMYFILNSYLIYMWSRYIGLTIWEKQFQLKWYRYIYMVALGINTLIVLLNLFIPVMFRLGSGGDFIVEPLGMWTFTIINYMQAVIALWSLIRNRNRLRSNTFVLLLLYGTFPVVGELIQLVFRTVDMVSFYALSAFMIFRVDQRNDVMRDPLTGIGNRLMLEDRLKRWFTAYRREYICGIMLDLDNMKQINDTYGHIAGDEALLRVAEILQNLSARNIIPIRYAGDEFVLLWQTEDPKEADDIRLLLREEEIKVNEGVPEERQLHYSLGNVVCRPDTVMTADDFLWLLDRRMYRNKQKIDRSIEWALENNAFYIVLQPVWSVADNRFVFAEVLLRMRDENGEEISPKQFIPVAEKSGVIFRLERFVLEEVCDFIEEHDMDALGLEYISINLSAAQSTRPTLAKNMLRTMRHAGIEGNRICLELTESAISENQETLLTNLRELGEAGVRIAMDDYGSGYSNMNRLTSLPLQIIKLDRSLMLKTDERAKEIFGLVVNMLRTLEVDIVVEGVETEEQAERMKAMGLNYLQGFYFARPMLPDKLIELLNARE